VSPFSILAAAAEAPDAAAWIDDEGTLDFRALASAVAPLLGGLAALPPGACLSLVAQPDRGSLVRLLAAIEAGVPVALLHPRWTAHERQRAAAAAGVTGELEALRPERSEAPRRPLDPERPLALVFTSGTTGRPRAAQLSHRAFAAAAAASATVLGWRARDRWLLAMPLAHVGGLSVVLRCVAARRPIVAARPETLVVSAQRHGATIVSLVPTVLARLVEGPPPPSLRCALVGGAACPEPLRRRALAAGWPVRTTYGLTEMCAQVATQRTDQDPGVGPPLPGVTLELRGERLFVRGPSLFSGFAGEPSPLDAQGFHDTGDFARLDPGGCLHLLGRRTDLVVTGGENVYPLEVEQVLERGPGIEAACVFGVPDPRWGSSVAAALVAPERPTVAALRSHLDTYLARYKHPRQVAWLERLPSTAAGKLDRAEAARLAGPLLEPLGSPGRPT
jgi:O-succinylbenzoic acid--CoA ligase